MNAQHPSVTLVENALARTPGARAKGSQLYLSGQRVLGVGSRADFYSVLNARAKRPLSETRLVNIEIQGRSYYLWLDSWEKIFDGSTQLKKSEQTTHAPLVLSFIRKLEFSEADALILSDFMLRALSARRVISSETLERIDEALSKGLEASIETFLKECGDTEGPNDSFARRLAYGLDYNPNWCPRSLIAIVASDDKTLVNLITRRANSKKHSDRIAEMFTGSEALRAGVVDCIYRIHKGDRGLPLQYLRNVLDGRISPQQTFNVFLKTHGKESTNQCQAVSILKTMIRGILGEVGVTSVDIETVNGVQVYSDEFSLLISMGPQGMQVDLYSPDGSPGGTSLITDLREGIKALVFNHRNSVRTANDLARKARRDDRQLNGERDTYLIKIQQLYPEKKNLEYAQMLNIKFGSMIGQRDVRRAFARLGITRIAEGSIGSRLAFILQLVIKDPRIPYPEIIDAIDEHFGVGLQITTVQGYLSRIRNANPSLTVPIIRMSRKSRVKETSPRRKRGKVTEGMKAHLLLLRDEHPDWRYIDYAQEVSRKSGLLLRPNNAGRILRRSRNIN